MKFVVLDHNVVLRCLDHLGHLHFRLSLQLSNQISILLTNHAGDHLDICVINYQITKSTFC